MVFNVPFNLERREIQKVGERDAMFEVEVLSKESIKPCSPTPQHLRTYNLSMIDRMVPCCHCPIVFFYTRSGINPQSLLRSLKDSLSRTLTRYYPVAGRLVEGNLLVDCSDQGVEFIEARVINGRLSQLQDITQTLRFLPCRSGAECSRYGPTGPLFAVQVNIFDEGDGVAVGVCLNHKIMDGVAVLAFLNEWAADARGAVEHTHHPRLDGASLFPYPGPIDEAEIPHFTPAINERRRMVFSPSSLARLVLQRSKSSADGGIFRPSRIEALTGLLLRCTIRARVSLNKDAMVVAAAHNLDMRGRLHPRLPVHTFGNVGDSAIIPATGPEGFCFERRMRSAVKEVDSIRQRPGMTAEEVMAGIGVTDVYMYYFSSLWLFPFYKVDFGWGKPRWVTPGRCEPIMDFFFFYPGREDGEVEVWAQMDEEMLGQLDKDQELAAYASSSTSIIGLFTDGGNALDRPAISSPAVKRMPSAL